MRVRVFTSGPFPRDKGTIELPALPRTGDSLLARDPGGAAYYSVRRLLHVEGGDPIVFVSLTDGEGFEGLDLAEAGLTPKGALEPMAVFSAFDEETPPLGL